MEGYEIIVSPVEVVLVETTSKKFVVAFSCGDANEFWLVVGRKTKSAVVIRDSKGS